MDTIYIIVLAGLYLFTIIYFAVRLAIKSMISNKEESTIREDNLSILDLRDLGLFDYNEMDEIQKVFQSKGFEKKENIKFEKYCDILTQLKNYGYLDTEEFNEKIRKLKKIFDKE